jgi:hypothetical protein
MQLISSVLLLLALAATPVFAQFQFFEQMFGGQQGHHGGHHRQREDIGSDSAWYQSNYDAGMYPL